MELPLDTISVLAELERIGWAYEPAGADEIRCRCPAHADTTPSCNINVVKRKFKCRAAQCGKAGDFVTFLALALTSAGKGVISRAVVWEDLCARYGIAEDKTVDGSVVERYHEMIWTAGPLLQALRDRGISDDVIRTYRIGYNDGRIQIPITNVSGQVVNIRKYLPGAPGPEKMRNVKGHGQPRLFPIDQLKYKTIIICGGEMKALATLDRLNDHKIGAICMTAGEGEGWTPSVLKLFEKKRVYVCMDIDAGGRKAALRLCALHTTHADWVGDILLPINKEKYPKGDINNYWGDEKKTADDFLALLKTIDKWKPTAIQEAEIQQDPPIRVHLSEATRARYSGKRIAVRANVSAMDETPYLVPRKVRCSCEKNQAFCINCPVYARANDDGNFVDLEIPSDSPALLPMIRTGSKGHRACIREGLKLPPCKAVTLKVLEHYNVEDIRLSPQLEITSRAQDQTVQACFYVGKGLETNQGYELEGRVFPHPGTQQAIILAYQAKAAEDALSAYRPKDEDLAPLAIFNTEDIDEKLKHIYSDLSTNVTRIYQRQDLHFAMDLAYHSPLFLRYEDRVVKGWTEVLIMGDSSQGKSETAIHLMRHYGLGERVECKNATVAGLLGGLEQLGTRWFVRWGVIPQHDQRLVFLEELKGTSTDVIGKLTDMRSSGIAEIPKIEKRRTHARTRLCCISNPRGDRPLAKYNFGIEAIVELIGGLEDVRRFDLSILVAADQVNATEVNKLRRHHPIVGHVYTGELCQKLILWSWTRTPEQTEFEELALEAISEEASRLCEEFSETVPLCDRGSMRYKLARLSAALAARLFSHNSSPQILAIREPHVRYMAQFIRRIYSDPLFGYKDYSTAVKMANTIVDTKIIGTRLLQVPFPRDFVEKILYTNEIEVRDIGDWCGWDRGEAIGLVSFLVRKNCLQRDGIGYRKTPAFIHLLKDFQASEELKKADRPDYVPDVDSPVNQY